MLLVLQVLLQLGHFFHLLLTLGTLCFGGIHVLFQLVHQFLIVSGHGLQHFGAGSELAETVGVQKNLQSAHAASGVKSYQTLFKLVDGVLDLRLGSVQLHGELGNAVVQILNVLTGGVDLLLKHVDLFLQGILISLLFRLFVAELVKLVLKFLLFRFQTTLLRLNLRHGLSGNRQGSHYSHAKGHKSGKQPFGKFSVHRAFPPHMQMKD